MCEILLQIFLCVKTVCLILTEMTVGIIIGSYNLTFTVFQKIYICSCMKIERKCFLILPG